MSTPDSDYQPAISINVLRLKPIRETEATKRSSWCTQSVTYRNPEYSDWWFDMTSQSLSPTFSSKTYQRNERKLQIDEIESCPRMARGSLCGRDKCWSWPHKELGKAYWVTVKNV